MADALIIGAGPAGAIAAIALARSNRTVTLIEQQRFPRDKVCGECLSATGIDVLTRAGLADRIRSLRPAILRTTILHGPDSETAVLPLPRDMWGVSRLRMDESLLDAARESGVRILQPARCEHLDVADRPAARIRCLDSNRISTLTADRIILADGKSALAGAKPQPTGDLGVKAHFVDVEAPQNAISLYCLDGHYVGVAPIEDNAWNLAFNAPAWKVKRANGDLDLLLNWALCENRALAAHFRRARRITDWLTSPLPRFPVRPHWPPNIIPVGNAAAALEPIGGEGMGLAMASAELAAHSLTNPTQLNKSYRQLWDVRRFMCRAAAQALSSRLLAGSVVDAVGASDSLAGAALGLIGK